MADQGRKLESIPPFEYNECMSRVIIGCVLSFICISSLSAEPGFVIAGRVTDSEGAAIPNARVLIHWDSSGSKVGLTDNIGITEDVRVLTNGNGEYSADVPVGFYDVFISAEAFTPIAAKVRVKQGHQTSFSVKLKVDPLVAKELD
jgi:Carboxypeptidase regulatory-like domain